MEMQLIKTNKSAFKSHAKIVLAVGLVLTAVFQLQSIAAAAPSAPFTLTLPSASVDLSDLDVRDHLNRRIASPEKKNQLRALFERSLMVLVLENLTPAKRLLNFILNQSWNGAFGWLHQAVRKATVVLAAWIAKTKWALTRLAESRGAVHAFTSRWRHYNAQTNFHSLIPTLLSSTTLLR